MNQYKDYGYSNDNADHSFYYLKSPLISFLDKNKDQLILDVGCGNGFLANYLIANGYDVYGTDASEMGIAIANQSNNNRFFVQNLTEDELPIELRNLKFDVIISTEVIEHLYDPVGFINFLKNILKPGGQIIISTPYHGYLKNLFIGLTNKWDAHFSPSWYGGHIKFWSKKSLSKILTDAGFTVYGFKGCGRFLYFWKSMIISAKLN
jgi:2-polyprenyl-3-methyl-5-hydroxy-6-metoxy-1,4-benzoquinol methylase